MVKIVTLPANSRKGMRFMQKRRLILVIGALFPLLCGVGFMTAHTAAQSVNDGYKLVFSDEFNLPDGSQPDPAIWSRKPRNNDQCNRWNSESPDVVFIRNGVLVCRAIPNHSEHSDTAKMLTGSIWTFNKYNVKYGRIEVRMRTNTQRGNFPAAWLKWQPKDWNTDPYAEIDIVEMFGDRGISFHAAHSQLTVSNSNHSEPNTYRNPLDVSQWHVYSLEWTPTRLVWSVDGKQLFTYKKSSRKRLLRRGQWTFDVPCYIVLNQSLGDGHYKDMVPNLTSTYETQFDWIRIYKKGE